jgi:hypothetical protein
MDCIHETVKRILTDTSLQQFDDKLHGLNERRPLDEDGNPIPSDSSESETKESEKEEEDENGDQFKKCSVCNKDCRTPNAQMINEIKKVKEIMKKTNETKHFRKPDYFSSRDISEYTKQFVLCWEPHKLLSSVNMTMSDLKCWNEGCNGKITVLQTLEHRSVEGLKSNGFIAFWVYACSKCKTNKQKSSLEIPSLHIMGFPLILTRQCPVITFLKSAVTQGLAEYVITMMTSELGAEQIMKGLGKLRDAEWAYHARIFLELQKQLATPSSTSGASSDLIIIYCFYLLTSRAYIFTLIDFFYRYKRTFSSPSTGIYTDTIST